MSQSDSDRTPPFAPHEAVDTTNVFDKVNDEAVAQEIAEDEAATQSAHVALLGPMPDDTIMRSFIENFCRRYKDVDGKRSVVIQFGEWTAAVSLDDIRAVSKRLSVLP